MLYDQPIIGLFIHKKREKKGVNMSITEEAERIIAKASDKNEQDIFVGVSALIDNPDVAVSVINQALLAYPVIENYPQFRRYFNSTLSSQKPLKPLKDDPRFHDPTRKALYSPQKYQVYLIWRYQKALKAYYQALEQYEQHQQRIRSILANYINEPREYVRFVFDSLAAADRAFLSRQRKIRISEKARRKHTHITGKSGYGKSELLKIIIHHYMTVNTHSSLILFDPHGDIAEEVGRFRENIHGERLVYIDLFLDDDYRPVLNPFILASKQVKPRTIDLITGEIYEIFEEILRGSGFTLQMETLLKPCITTLLLMGGRDITDLQKFMDDDHNEIYLQFAYQHLYNPAQRDFLKNDFWKDTYSPTKQAIKTKIQSLLNSSAFLQVLTGQPTFNLNSLINQQKVIVFNLSVGKLGNFTSNLVGRFLLAQIKSLAFQRADTDKTERITTHLIIDECQRYLSPSIQVILTETRKYALHLTLAHQYYGQDMSTALNDTIASNTAVKITGLNNHKSLTAFAKETGADMDVMKKLSVGEFYLKEGKNSGIKIKAPAHLVDGKNAMNQTQWQAIKKEQLKRYYRVFNETEAIKNSSKEGKNLAINHTPKKTPAFEIEL